ncbi:putative low-density lipoprotein receptor-related protein 1B [Triplophysa rosa]|uniref:Low-density lipoprotein receptor-related protein 1B n=1 Tax=Triplophysa rosa TaxID=992332 RepID=A0A9W7WV09_TRIRA|nr:putative low-density lipoprotein receptor-related protein 1B [Triplophysa rosa]
MSEYILTLLVILGFGDILANAQTLRDADSERGTCLLVFVSFRRSLEKCIHPLCIFDAPQRSVKALEINSHPPNPDCLTFSAHRWRNYSHPECALETFKAEWKSIISNGGADAEILTDSVAVIKMPLYDLGTSSLVDTATSGCPPGDPLQIALQNINFQICRTRAVALCIVSL